MLYSSPANPEDLPSVIPYHEENYACFHNNEISVFQDWKPTENEEVPSNQVRKSSEKALIAKILKKYPLRSTKQQDQSKKY